MGEIGEFVNVTFFCAGGTLSEQHLPNGLLSGPISVQAS